MKASAQAPTRHDFRVDYAEKAPGIKRSVPDSRQNLLLVHHDSCRLTHDLYLPALAPDPFALLASENAVLK